MRHRPVLEVPEIQVHAREGVPAADAERARSKVEAVLARIGRPVLFARVKLDLRQDPAVARPAVAQANVDVNGRLLRVQVAEPTVPEAVDRMVDRLQGRAEQLLPDWESLRGARPVPGEWRHGGTPTDRPPYFPRPVEERGVVRHKVFTLKELTPEEAAFDMDALDYDFLLYRDLDSGRDCVMYRDEGGGRELTWTAPELTLAEAKQRLEATGAAFVFFTEHVSGRGRVLYHRYDGHYGLITPAE